MTTPNAETTANQNQTADNNPAASEDKKNRLIAPQKGHEVYWKLKWLINSVDFLSRELEQLKIRRGVVLTCQQTSGLNEAIYAIEQETEDVRDALLTAKETKALKPVINDVRLAEDQFTFLLSVFELGDSQSREFHGGDVPSICLNLNNIRDTLSKAYKRIAKFAEYNFLADTDLYKQDFSVMTGFSNAINGLDILIEKFTGCEEIRGKVLKNRKKTAKEVRRLSDVIWTLRNLFSDGDEIIQHLVRAESSLLVVIQNLYSKNTLFDTDDLAALGVIVRDAKDNCQIALDRLLEQERQDKNPGGLH